jgi:hypothetical protein
MSRDRKAACEWAEYAVRLGEERLAASIARLRTLERAAEGVEAASGQELKLLGVWKEAHRQKTQRAAANVSACQAELRRLLAIRAALRATQH